ncbi:MAG: cupin-like domain-containing protein [Acidimicrobiales bacterium]
MPDPARFVQTHVFGRQPVVITDLFAGQELATIDTIEGAVAAWGTTTLDLQEEYASAEGRDRPADAVSMSLGEYADFSRSNRSTRLCCTEYETPARVLATYRLPPICTSTVGPGPEIFDLPRKYGDFDLATNIFVANEGNVAHLHYDGDQRQVLLHQVYGSKRVILFQPAAAVHLRTLDGPFTRPSLAGVNLEDMSLDEKLALVDAADGYHTVLEPGETLYIPMLMWHHLEYLDDAMSLGLRFGRTRYGRFLSLDNFHRDPYIQNVASKLVGPDEALAALEPVVEQVKTAYVKPVPDVSEKVREVRALFRDLCATLCPEACAESLCPPDREEEQVARIVASNDMRGGLKYADPALIQKSRPVGAITPRQRDIIGAGIDRAGYSIETERAVVFNRSGKGDVGELTKGEAAQLIAYLGTPGARW